MSVTVRIVIIGFIGTALFSNVWAVTGHVVNAGWMFSTWWGVLLWGIGLIIESIQLVDRIGKQ